IQRVNIPRSLAIRAFATNVEPSGLIVSAIGSAGDLPVLPGGAAAGHPGFQIELAIGRAAKIAGAGVDDLKRQPKSLEDVLFDMKQLLMMGLALLRRAEDKHFDLGELMNAIQTASVAAGCAGLGPKTVGQANIFERQLLLVQDLIAVHAAERDLG